MSTRVSHLRFLFAATAAVSATTLPLASDAGEIDSAPAASQELSGARRASGPRLHLEAAGSHFIDLGSGGAWQANELGYGVVANAALEWAAWSRLGFELRIGGAHYQTAHAPDDPSLKPTNGGGFYALGAGFRAHPFHDVGGLFIGGALGVARTGTVYRPTFDVRLGWDFVLAGGFEAGPYFGYLHVVETNRDLRPEDARAWMLGFQMSFGGVVRPEKRHVEVVAVVVPKSEPPKEKEPEITKADPPPDPPPLEVIGDKIVLVDRIHFEYASSKIESSSLPALQILAKHILEHPEYSVVSIDGHTDEIGGDEWNMKLSISRAEAVRSQLVSYGVSGKILRIRGYGKSRPRVAGHDDGARAENRRVEFKFEVRKP